MTLKELTSDSDILLWNGSALNGENLARNVLLYAKEYGWHDLTKNPDDLPKKTGLYLAFASFVYQISEFDFDSKQRRENEWRKWKLEELNTRMFVIETEDKDENKN